MTTTTTKTSARVMATDEKTGRRYVKSWTVEGATVTVTKFVGEEVGGTYRWASALYDVTSPAGELFAGAVKWDGQHWKVGSKVAPSLTKAVRAVLGIEQLPAPRQTKPSTRKGTSAAAPKADTISPGEAVQMATAAADAAADQAAKPSTRTRKSAATRRAEKAAADLAAQSGSAVIETDPDTGLPRIRPEVQTKADAIVAAQLARNAEAGK